MPISTHTHTYMHASIRACAHTCMHACMHAYIHTYIHTDRHTYRHTYRHKKSSPDTKGMIKQLSSHLVAAASLSEFESMEPIVEATKLEEDRPPGPNQRMDTVINHPASMFHCFRHLL